MLNIKHFNMNAAAELRVMSYKQTGLYRAGQNINKSVTSSRAASASMLIANSANMFPICDAANRLL